MIKKYQKKPIVIEAIQFNGKNHTELLKFCGNENATAHPTAGLYIYTLEGDLQVSKGDFVIKGIKGEFYPCKPDIFKASYEEVTDDNK